MGIIYLASQSLKNAEKFNIKNMLCSYYYIKNENIEEILKNKELKESENKNK